MKILVTGGAGYIGSVTSAILSEAGHEVTVLDNLSSGYKDAVPSGIQFIEANVADFDEAISKEDTFDAIVHLAGSIAAGESMQVPELYWHNNTIASLKLLDSMRSRGIKKLIFASTAAVYGEPSELPITEKTATKPTNTYGMTKLAIDMAITSEAYAHGLDATSLRFFNVAGSYKTYGERHPQETHIIPLLLETALSKRNGFTIYGDDYPTSDGTCLRDYIHVYDLAKAILLALRVSHPADHRIYNLANGKGFTNKQVVDMVKKVTGKDFPVEVGPRRSGDPASLVASSEKAQKELDWEPTRPTLEQMVQEAWDFTELRSTNSPQ